MHFFFAGLVRPGRGVGVWIAVVPAWFQWPSAEGSMEAAEAAMVMAAGTMVPRVVGLDSEGIEGSAAVGAEALEEIVGTEEEVEVMAETAEVVVMARPVEVDFLAAGEEEEEGVVSVVEEAVVDGENV